MKIFLKKLFVFLGLFLGAQQLFAIVIIETVSVGDTNNTADSATGYGAVQSGYKIGKTEVTATQYCAFLNAVAQTSDPYALYNTNMASDRNVASIQRAYDTTNKSYLYTTIGGAESFPITYVSWPSAARFCNWLHNDQPTGNEDASTTEEGAYELDGLTNGVVLAATNACWSLPTENQWYKAAYCKGGNLKNNYWKYPTQKNTAPVNSMTGTMKNNANIYLVKKGVGSYCQSNAPYLTPVNTFSNSAGQYQTYDMGGNVYEWVDANRDGLGTNVQVVRGGAWSSDCGVATLASTNRNATNLSSASVNNIGFRVAIPAQSLNLSWVTVGNPGNLADPATGYGAVKTTFRIGEYPITVQQYVLFLNSVASGGDPYSLCNYWMPSDSYNGSIICTLYNGLYYYSARAGRKNFPVNYISWFNAARFCNWVQNGCPTGSEGTNTTETGAYTLRGVNDGSMVVAANTNAQYYIPSEDQWYKAAYYNGDGSCYVYPTQENTAPGNCIGDSGSQANYNFATDGTDYGSSPLTPVGMFSNTMSYYGAYDMGGNIWEWNDTTFSFFGMVKIEGRGGSFRSPSSDLQKESKRFFFAGQIDTGFRIAAPTN